MENSSNHATPELRYDNELATTIIEYFGQDCLQQAVQHCLSNPNIESGGYIYKQGQLNLYEPLPNISNEPDTHLEFEKSIAILNKIFNYQRSGVAFVHSHVYQDLDGTFEASVKDVELASVDVLDWIIVDTVKQNLLFIGGNSDFSRMHGLIGAQVLFKL